MSQPADISEVKKIGSLNKKRCLHKGLIIGQKIYIVGGTDFDKIEILDRNTMTHIEHMESVSALKSKLETVTFNNFFLKKCSSA